MIHFYCSWQLSLAQPAFFGYTDTPPTALLSIHLANLYHSVSRSLYGSRFHVSNLDPPFKISQDISQDIFQSISQVYPLVI